METFDAERFFAPARQELSKHLGTTAVHNLAVTASRQIAPLCESGEQPIGDITSQNWRTLVDSSQPTIGLHVGELSYAPVLAWASQRLRARGEQSCNVLLLPPPLYARETANLKHYYAGHGAVVDDTGRVYAGDFPVPVSLDAANGQETHQFFQKRGVHFMNSPREETLLDNKQWVHHRLARTVLRHTELLGIWRPSKDLVEWQDASPAHADIVTKPADGAQGRRVLLHSLDDASPEEVLLRHAEIYANDEVVLVEKREKSLPLHHPQSDVQLDWNIRMLVAGGEMAGAYARVGRQGGPINVAQGAQKWELAHTLAACGLDAPQQTKLEADLDGLAMDIFLAFGIPLIGADIIVNPDLETVVVELNGKYSGGVESLMDLQPDQDAKMTIPEAIIAGWRTGILGDIKRPFFRRWSERAQTPVAVDGAIVLEHLFYHADQNEDLKPMATTVANKLIDTSYAPEDLRAMAADYLDYSAESESQADQVAAVPQAIPFHQHSIEALHTPEITAGCKRGSHTLDTEPVNVPMRQKAARRILTEYGSERTLYILNSHFASWETARVHAMAIFWQALEHTHTDALGMPVEVGGAIEQIIARHLAAPLKPRNGLVIELEALRTNLTPQLQTYMQPVVTALHWLYAESLSLEAGPAED